ncbi:MAG TPA: hypothetical protein VFG10_18375 [Saprospiraceae bacterium]|nr:hypothetical protein [Saprospiraceae bacterium]
MTSLKYPEEKATKEKIQELFAYRRLTDLLGISNMAKDQKFTQHLVDVQYQIYMLDSYLESQWEIHKKDLKVYWDGIRSSLQQMGLKKKQISDLVSEIKEYQQIERDCRKDKWPTSVSFQKFYTTKSCDVRLIRHLIYTSHKDLQHLWKENAWLYYDMITEVHDDIEDLEEDIKTYNGNRFLISILRKGAEKTRQDYEEHLKSITEKANAYFADRMHKGKNKQLAAWTAARSKETIKLLNNRINSKVTDLLSQSLLLNHMN